MSNRRISLQTKLLGLAALLLSFTAIIAVVGISSLSSELVPGGHLLEAVA
jgi:hypothetical protein